MNTDQPQPQPAPAGEAAELEFELDALRAEREALTREVAGLRRQLQHAERLRRETAAGVARYEERLEDELRRFRGQRAWDVMLYLRKAYTILVRSLQARRVPSPAAVLGLLFRPAKNLDAYDIHFPVLRQMLPAGLRRPLDIEMPDVAVESAAHYFAGETPPQTKYDVLILPVFEFDFRCQRPQHLAMQFAAAGHRVFWLSPSRTCDAAAPYAVTPLQPGIWEVQLRSALPNIYLDELRSGHVEEAMKRLQPLFRDFAVAESCALLQLPFWRRLGLRLREAFDTRVLYDCMDDWQTMPDISRFNRAEEPRLAADCDILIATGKHLVERHREAGREAVLVRNGADFARFSSARSAGYLKDVPRPVVGYFGAIADWFDYDLYYEVARSRPNYSFVLIGAFGLEEKPSHAQALRLASLPNVRLLGHKPYAEIPAHLADFDVCTIPFVLNEVTKATDPVKLYEYLSQGKPVVATPMAELKEAGGLISIAATAEEFARAIDSGLAEAPDAEIRRRRVEFAARQRWTDRWNVMDEAIRRAFPLVSIVIVTYNSAEYVELCFESLLRNTSYPNFEVIVFDNASKDSTVERVERFALGDPRFRVIRNEENLGFAGGNNQAAELAKGEYLVLLNVDTVLSPGWLGRLVRHFALRPKLGLIGPVTNQIGNEAKIHVPYRNVAEMERFAGKLASERFGDSISLEVGALFCAVIPKAVWEEVGGLDQDFKVGMFEDDDLCFRIRDAGLRIEAAEDCFVHHFGQGSFSKLRPDYYQEVFAANRKRFEEKWNVKWTGHLHRPGVTPEEGQFSPADFAAAGSA